MEMLQCIDLKQRGPIVTFDARLGRQIPKGRVLDFSERQFRMLCESVAPSDLGAADHACIVITPGRGYGYYDDKTRTIEVEYGGNTRRSNRDLRHETSHYLVHRKNELTNDAYYDLTRNLHRIGGWLLWVAAPSASICTSIYTINDIENTQLPAEFYVAAKAVAVLGALASMMILSHRLHPEELRADYVEMTHAYIKPLSLRYASEY